MSVNKGGRKATLIPNLCHALGLSRDKRLKLIDSALKDLNISLDRLKVLEILMILTNEETLELGICLDLSASNLQELGLSKTSAYRYITIIKHINKTLERRTDVLRMADWTKSRLYSAS
jgi:hypothetical protein